MFKRKDDFEPLEAKVWLSSPTMYGDELKYMQEAYETNWMSTVGQNINEVERLAADYVGVKYAVALSSGTASLHLAMKLAGIEAYGMPKIGHGVLEGRKVFCSDLTFDATVNPVVYEGGEPVYIDTERDSWNMDPIVLKRAFEIYSDVRIIVCAHLYGTPGKISEIIKIAEDHNAILVEDAAESLGATYKGRQTGLVGTIQFLLMVIRLLRVHLGAVFSPMIWKQQIKCVNGALKVARMPPGTSMKKLDITIG